MVPSSIFKAMPAPLWPLLFTACLLSYKDLCSPATTGTSSHLQSSFAPLRSQDEDVNIFGGSVSSAFFHTRLYGKYLKVNRKIGKLDRPVISPNQALPEVDGASQSRSCEELDCLQWSGRHCLRVDFLYIFSMAWLCYQIKSFDIFVFVFIL